MSKCLLVIAQTLPDPSEDVVGMRLAAAIIGVFGQGEGPAQVVQRLGR
ncbi:hypothetical protein SAMN04488564_11558 [Lentzea waywayandensis]|uniref:Uncharacterized protein n=1 Tax=Lentzea waywayandensis TaxID=84724 RepID=A0A1I6FFP2_9PSEU|nr:hypothetical protein SAMN04488564_11558 [Lentzea waywayandensis]